MADAHREVRQGHGPAVDKRDPGDAGGAERQPVNGMDVLDGQDLVLPDAVRHAADGNEEQFSHKVQL